MNKAKEPKLRRIRILGMHPDDAFYPSREQYVGQVGQFAPNVINEQCRSGFFAGRFYYDRHPGGIYFLGIRYKRLLEDPND